MGAANNSLSRIPPLNQISSKVNILKESSARDGSQECAFSPSASGARTKSVIGARNMPLSDVAVRAPKPLNLERLAKKLR